MKRIDIYYAGQHYSVSGREYEELRQEILEGVTAGRAWLRVNIGEGQNVPCDLLISPGVPISLVPIAAT